MENTHKSLTALFEAIADAIRGKTGGTSQLVADNFPALIAGIVTPAENLKTWEVTLAAPVSSGSIVTLMQDAWLGSNREKLRFVICADKAAIEDSDFYYVFSDPDDQLQTSKNGTVYKCYGHLASADESTHDVFGITEAGELKNKAYRRLNGTLRVVAWYEE